MNLKLDQQEILRYLGYGGQTVDAQTNRSLQDGIRALTEMAKPRFCYRIFSVQKGDAPHTLYLPECRLTIRSKDLFSHLRGCDQCALLAATLGVEADNLIRIAQSESMSRAVILDACATEMIEKLCDAAEEEIALLAQKDGKVLQSRFSPGYGDLSLSLQIDFGRILDTVRQIGLTVTERALMLPRKSVTAVIGFTNQKTKAPTGCLSCSMRGRCPYQKEGKHCGR